MRKLTIIVPCYNERHTVGSVIAALSRLSLPVPFEIIVVDDGSTDGTNRTLPATARRNKRITVITHPTNLGKGAAVSTALNHATGDYVLIQDADAEYDPADIPKLVTYAKETGAVAVYGSRNLGHTKRGMLVYYLGGVFLSRLANVIYRQSLTDVASGYKLFRKSALTHPLTEQRFGFCYELTAMLARQGVHIAEVPVRYEPRTPKEGKKITLADGVHAVGVLLHHALPHRLGKS